MQSELLGGLDCRHASIPACSILVQDVTNTVFYEEIGQLMMRQPLVRRRHCLHGTLGPWLRGVWGCGPLVSPLRRLTSTLRNLASVVFAMCRPSLMCPHPI